jgi:Carboxypeptidase regulatory-like domain
MSYKQRLAAIALFMASMASLAAGQSSVSGAISGLVRDSSGAVIPGAQVRVTSLSTAELVRNEKTDPSGLFTFNLLPPGSYSVQVNAPNFAQTTVRDVPVRVTETTRITIILAIGSVKEKVEVTAEGASVKTADATTGESLSGSTIVNLPLATRNFQQLLTLSAGVTSSLNSASQLGRGSVSINVNGGRDDNNSYKIEGVNANDPTIGELTYTPLPSPDVMAEFKVSTSMYDATQGRNGGGSINAIMKSGSSDFHFDIFEYFRNTVLNANEYFLNAQGRSRPVIKQNIFGGSLGGPVGRNGKLGYFFVNYQGTRQRSGDSAGTILDAVIPSIPSQRDAASLAAAFSTPSFPVAAADINPVALALLNAKSDQFGGQGGGWLIPSLPPTPGLGGQSLLALSTPGKFTEDQFTVNWDREFRAARDRISARLFYSNGETFQPFGADSLQIVEGGQPSAANLNFPLDIPLRGRFGSITETHLFSNTLINEFRFGVNVISYKLKNGPVVTARQLGIQRPTNNVSDQMYRLSFASFQIGPNPADVTKSLSDSFSLQDTVSYVRGRHTVRVGGEDSRVTLRRYLPVADNGLVFFIPTGSEASNNLISDFQYFLVGQPAFGLGSSGVPNHDWRISSFSVFGQDDYRATKSLTLNLGMRVEVNGAPYDTLCHFGNTDPQLANTTGQPFFYPNCVDKFHLPGIKGQATRSGLKNNWATVIEPRIGFAYDVGGRQTTSIRGGFGIYGVREDTGAVDNLSFSPPFQPTVVAAGDLATLFQGLLPPVGTLDPNAIPTASVLQGFVINGTATPTMDTTQTPVYSGNVINFFGLTVPRRWISPTTQQWNLTVERVLGRGWVANVGYVGTHGVHLREVSDRNQARLVSPQNLVILTSATGVQYVVTQNTASNINARAPFQGLAPSAYEAFVGDANSHYHGLQASVLHRFTRGLYWQTAYTFSKSTDDTSTSNVAFDTRLNNQLDPRASRGLSDYDHKHRFVTSVAYAVPQFRTGHGFLNRLVSNWQSSAILTIQSGQPFSVIDSAGGSAYGLSSPNLVTPVFAPGFSCSSAKTSGSVHGRLNKYVNAAAFQPAPVVGPDGVTGYGNVGRNCFRGSSQSNLDFSIGRVFPVTERQKLTFSTEFFNLLNHPSFASPSIVDIENPSFGAITSTVGTPRLIQFSLRYSY